MIVLVTIIIFIEVKMSSILKAIATLIACVAAGDTWARAELHYANQRQLSSVRKTFSLIEGFG